MIKLNDGTKVSSRSYYFLLDWNEKDDKKYLASKFGVNSLKELNIGQYAQLFLFATVIESTTLTNQN